MRGLDTLQLLYWLFTTTYSDGLTSAVNIARLVNVPSALPSYLSTLNSVLCDSSTLFIALPLQWSVNRAIVGFGYAASCAGLLQCLVTFCFLLRYRQHAVVRATSPLFQSISLLGVVLLYLTVLVLLRPATAAVCSALQWLSVLGLCLTFAPLFAKAYRIYSIFGRKRLAVVKMSNGRLLAIVGALCTAELVLLAVWQAVGPLSPQLNADAAADGSVTDHVQCGTGAGVETGMLLAAGLGNSALLVCGAFMSLSTRRVSQQFNESSQQALAIYNVVFSLGVITAVLIAVDADGDVLTGVLVFATLWIAFFTTSILNLPQMLKVLSARTGEAAVDGMNGNAQSDGDAAMGGFSFVSVEVFSSVTMMTAYQRALQKQLQLIEAKLTLLRGRQGAPPASARVRPGIVSPPAVSVRSTSNKRESSILPGGLRRQPSALERHPGGHWIAPVLDEALPVNGSVSSRTRHRRARSAAGLRLSAPLPTPPEQPASAM